VIEARGVTRTFNAGAGAGPPDRKSSAPGRQPPRPARLRASADPRAGATATAGANARAGANVVAGARATAQLGPMLDGVLFSLLFW
jgi:hypothetical protein